MKKFLMSCLATVLCMLLSLPTFSQDKADSIPTLGLAGDNLDLYAVLDLFQKSKTIEGFEKSLNDEKTKINNLDLNLDKKVDFIKVVTKKKDDSYTFILQVDVTKKETQDVAVILLDRDKDKKVSLQIVGDEELYGKDYIIEPKGNSSVTANPGYTGDNPVTVDVPATTVVVQSAPIVQYVYSPAYVPYAPPYYYGYYPPWFGFATVMAVGIYRSNHYYHHHGYYGGHYGGNNNVIINNGNRNNFNNYNNNKMRSNTVSDNRARGNYGNGSGNRQGSGARASTMPSNRPGNGASVSNRQSPSMSNRQSPSTSNRQSPSVSNRQSPSTSNRQSPSYSSPSSRSGSMGGGGRSMGGGGSRGGGGGRRR
ncbi:hypothetical protein [Solitalea canadensis]|uniref:DUF3300 domain-containing protein n=1 Tax=Solitalea canadensis (strain ATCC 29591 / DSM 3403 / JCM 21819 / LMG 8368 / NBRC 15130 / NCIMB 12057 / USAM 9D) TaxID=929556 RepID=H8KNF1_SOLCM|nr:hypothetical protein [Solitalea canadensis]AFD07949.1 hypothetical protein Solca_2930 [Solitalea canadensis DSM 3403]